VARHALVQDAAYDSLLKSRKQELHTKIACVIEQRFPNIRSIEPEVLAHHLTAANLAEAAVPLWQAAGELGLRRMALAEAIAHLDQGLELVSSLPRSSERDTSELGCAAALEQRGSGSKAGRPRKFGAACIRPLSWRNRSSATMHCCPSFGD
jgi:predicted ATPase